jgi:predicted adenylyl cyclase CyaB
MPQNLELKASVASVEHVRLAARRLGARRIGTWQQRDTYYAVRRGRLKLREVGPHAELIAYERPNNAGSRYSRYDVFPIKRPSSLRRMLGAALDVRAVVHKQRTVYLYKNCRIHADRVRGLGSFLEFEVIVKGGRTQAQTLMQAMIRHFGVTRRAVVGRSYCDLLISSSRKTRR